MATLTTAPSDLIEVIPCLAPISVAAAADLDLTTRIDISDYDHILIQVAIGVTDVTTTLTPLHFAALTGGTGTAMVPATVAHTATDDGESHVAEYRTHGLGGFLGFNFLAGAGTSAISFIQVIGFKRQASANLVGLVDTAATGVA